MKLTSREGFALPMTLLVIGLLTAGVFAAYARIDSEQRVVRSGVRQVDAYVLAQDGLDRALSRRRIAPDSQRFQLDGGYADVFIRRIRPAVDTAMPVYLIRSRGVPHAAGALGIPAQHIVTQFANFEPATLEVAAGWSSLSGLLKQGDAGTLSGYDESDPRCLDGEDVAGVAVPTGGYVQNGGTSVPEGDPAILPMGTQQEMAEHTKIDWDAIVNDNAIPADLVVDASSFPTTEYFEANPDFWPVVRVDGTLNVDPPHSGRGLLIITGDLHMNGNFTWDGIILVGGRITSNGYQEVRGTTISGLNVKFGQAVGASSIGNGTKIFRYHSCNVENALNALGALQPVRNGWADNWMGY
jgi:hypothetical protein